MNKVYRDTKQRTAIATVRTPILAPPLIGNRVGFMISIRPDMGIQQAWLFTDENTEQFIILEAGDTYLEMTDESSPCFQGTIYAIAYDVNCDFQVTEFIGI